MAHKKTITVLNVLTLGALATLVMGAAYLMARSVIYMSLSGLWYEKGLGFLLLFAEIFILIHGAGYSLQLLRISRREPEKQLPPVLPEILPPVAVVVSAFKEPLDVVEKTLVSFYNLRYPNKHLYLLDDTRYDAVSPEKTEEMKVYRAQVDALVKKTGVGLFRRKWHSAKAGMLNDFLALAAGRERPDFEFTGPQNETRPPDFKYLVVFDADQTPFPNFLEDLVAQMEADPQLAFVQTPQYYTNFRNNRVARASGLQQAVFYEYICEGKDTQDAMFCCGTNVIFRREALEAVGGIEESSVTEDFATSLKFHTAGWRSAYSNKAQAFGLGPEDLGGYLKQQTRWALGTIGMFRTLLSHFVRRPFALTPAQWTEYFLSSTYYFIGWAFFILVLCPIVYLLLDVPSYFAYPHIFLLFFLPYLVITLLMFFWTLRKRYYSPKDIILGQLLVAVAFPAYMKASLYALLNKKTSFVVTPKGSSHALPLLSLWAQLGLAGLNIVAIVWGIHRLIYEPALVTGLLVNIFWCLYHFIMLSAVLYLNNPEEPLKESHA
jgi:cellulose synthase (UDP-forming)